MSTDRTTTVITALNASAKLDDCNGIAGQKGLHAQAADELRRLRSALDSNVNMLKQVSSKLPSGALRKAAERVVESGLKTLDYQ